MSNLKNKVEFDVVFEVVNGNPNGDPDLNNSPRKDSLSGHGYVTDVCLKRKIRNFVDDFYNTEDQPPRYDIFIKGGDRYLNDKIEEAVFKTSSEEMKQVVAKKDKKAKKQLTSDEVSAARKYICERYFDVRTFGAVLSTGDFPLDTVRGPVQVTFAESVDTVDPEEISITRCVATKEEKKQNDELKDNKTIGKKNYLPYGLYRFQVYVSANLANKTNFNEEDLDVLKTALINMFEHDRAASRGKINVKKIIMYRHENMLGAFPSDKLFEKLTITKKADCDLPTCFDDYELLYDDSEVAGVEVVHLL